MTKDAAILPFRLPVMKRAERDTKTPAAPFEVVDLEERRACKATQPAARPAARRFTLYPK